MDNDFRENRFLIQDIAANQVISGVNMNNIKVGIICAVVKEQHREERVESICKKDGEGWGSCKPAIAPTRTLCKVSARLLSASSNKLSGTYFSNLLAILEGDLPVYLTASGDTRFQVPLVVATAVRGWKP